jgi:hypothetical protein
MASFFLGVFQGEMPSQYMLPTLDPLRPADQYFAQTIHRPLVFSSANDGETIGPDLTFALAINF